jgi:hypothetical protein
LFFTEKHTDEEKLEKVEEEAENSIGEPLHSEIFLVLADYCIHT